MFGRKRQSKTSPFHHTDDSSSKPTSSFAQQVIDLETELDCKCSFDVVQRLLALYSQAIEQLESVKDPSYLHYQERMQKFLARPDVLLAIKESQPKRHERSSHTPTPDISRESYRRRADEKEKIRAKIQINKDITIERTTEKTINSHTTESSSASKRIQENLQSQAENLNLRLRERVTSGRSSSQAVRIRSRTFTNTVFGINKSLVTQESDRSGGGPRKSNIEFFEEEVERAMEKYIEEKIMTKKRLTDNYQEQMQEITKMGDSQLIRSILNSMKSNLDEEIEKAIQDIEIRRKQEISAIRQQYL